MKRSLRNTLFAGIGILANVNQTASDNAEEFGFRTGDLIQEWLWDDDVDDTIREK